MERSIRETAYKTFNRVAKIVDPKERKAALRQILNENNNLAIVLQRCYHPNYNFRVIKGPVPDTIAKKSNHDEHGPFYNSIRFWDKFRVTEELANDPTKANLANMAKHVVERHFLDLYEAVANDDAELLVGIKDKKLPWEELNAEFVVDAIPELFPPSFRPGETYDPVQAAIQAQATTKSNTPTVATTKKGFARQLMELNPGLGRQDYIKLFMANGISKVTATQYYQELIRIIKEEEAS